MFVLFFTLRKTSPEYTKIRLGSKKFAAFRILINSDANYLNKTKFASGNTYDNLIKSAHNE